MSFIENPPEASLYLVTTVSGMPTTTYQTYNKDEHFKVNTINKKRFMGFFYETFFTSLSIND